MSNTSDDARLHPRVIVDLPAVLEIGDVRTEIAIVLIDLGAGGVFTKLKRLGAPDGSLPPPPVGARATLSFRMIGDRLCEAQGEVVRHDGDGFGIQFNILNPGMKSFTRHLAKLPVELRQRYIADILHPKLALGIPQ